MNQNELPERWLLIANDPSFQCFPELGVLYKHKNGTRCVFKHANFIIKYDLNEALILTKFNGYHILPFSEDECEIKSIKDKVEVKYSYNEMEDSYPEETKVRLKIPYKVIKKFWRKIFGDKNA